MHTSEEEAPAAVTAAITAAAGIDPQSSRTTQLRGECVLLTEPSSLMMKVNGLSRYLLVVYYTTYIHRY